MQELGDVIPVRGDGLGTVAYVEVGGRKVFGVNSTALVNDADKPLGRMWRDRPALLRCDLLQEVRDVDRLRRARRLENDRNDHRLDLSEDIQGPAMGVPADVVDVDVGRRR